jgi:molecular chaperone GrpE (heat shock protein)
MSTDPQTQPTADQGFALPEEAAQAMEDFKADYAPKPLSEKEQEDIKSAEWCKGYEKATAQWKERYDKLQAQLQQAAATAIEDWKQEAKSFARSKYTYTVSGYIDENIQAERSVRGKRQAFLDGAEWMQAQLQKAKI